MITINIINHTVHIYINIYINNIENLIICYGFKTIQNRDPDHLDHISFPNFDGSNAISQSQHAPGLNFSKVGKLGDNCIQNFHLVRNIILYMVGNLVLRWCINGFPTMYLTI